MYYILSIPKIRYFVKPIVFMPESRTPASRSPAQPFGAAAPTNAAGKQTRIKLFIMLVSKTQIHSPSLPQHF